MRCVMLMKSEKESEKKVQKEMRHLTESNLSVTRSFLHENGDGVNFTTFALLCKCQRQAAFHRANFKPYSRYIYICCMSQNMLTNFLLNI